MCCFIDIDEFIHSCKSGDMCAKKDGRLHVSKICSIFVEFLRKFCEDGGIMNKEEWKHKAYKVLANKYLVAILVFAVVYTFVGDQSLLKRLQRAGQIRETEERLSSMRADTDHALRMMEVLQDTDSLESFARERYGMHTGEEDVYMVKE